MRHLLRSREGWVRPLLIALAVLALVGSLTAVAAWSWLKDALISTTERVQSGLEQGAEIGRHLDEAKCLDLAKERAAVTTSLTGTMANGSYLEGCLLTSRPTPGFCARVAPAGAEFEEAWMRRECPGDAAERSECRRLAMVAQQFCADGQRKATVADVRAYIAERAP